MSFQCIKGRREAKRSWSKLRYYPEISNENETSIEIWTPLLGPLLFSAVMYTEYLSNLSFSSLFTSEMQRDLGNLEPLGKQ